MSNILDQVAKSAARAQRHPFRPRSTAEFFAMLLAARLHDRPAVQHYSELTAHYSEEQLLVAYNRARRGGTTALGRRFHEELQRVREPNGHHESGKRLVAIRVDRRTVALAILDGVHLHYVQARQLASSSGKAIAGAAGFVANLLGKFDGITTAALERYRNGDEAQRATLYQEIANVLSEQAIGLAEVDRDEMLAGLGWPPLHSRDELREIASSIWPALDEEPGGPWTHDAAILGLYVQTARLFETIDQD